MGGPSVAMAQAADAPATAAVLGAYLLRAITAYLPGLALGAVAYALYLRRESEGRSKTLWCLAALFFAVMAFLGPLMMESAKGVSHAPAQWRGGVNFRSKCLCAGGRPKASRGRCSGGRLAEAALDVYGRYHQEWRGASCHGLHTTALPMVRTAPSGAAAGHSQARCGNHRGINRRRWTAQQPVAYLHVRCTGVHARRTAIST